MVITAAPFSSVAAIIDIHIQCDSLLLWDRSSWRTEGRVGAGQGGKVDTQDRRKGKKTKTNKKSVWWSDEQTGSQRPEALELNDAFRVLPSLSKRCSGVMATLASSKKQKNARVVLQEEVFRLT